MYVVKLNVGVSILIEEEFIHYSFQKNYKKTIWNLQQRYVFVTLYIPMIYSLSELD